MTAIQQSIIFALQKKSSVKIKRVKSGTLITDSIPGRKILIFCCEDDWKNIKEPDLEVANEDVHLFRVWFNQPSQVARATESGWPTTEIAFFKEFERIQDRSIKIIDYAPESSKAWILAQPWVSRKISEARKDKILFVGEVSTPDELVLNHGKENYYLWAELAREVLDGKTSLSSIAISDFTEQFIHGFQNNFRRMILMDLISHFGPEKVTLVGSDWRKLGVRSRRTIHFASYRRMIQSSAGICLDTGSKSTWSLWYPRFTELIEDGGLVSMCVAADIEGFAEGAFAESRDDLFNLIVQRQTNAEFSESLDDALGVVLDEKRHAFRKALTVMIEEQLG